MTTQNQQQSSEQVPVTTEDAIENSAHCASVSNGRWAPNAGILDGGGASESGGVDSRETSLTASRSGCSGDGVSTSVLLNDCLVKTVNTMVSKKHLDPMARSADRSLGRANTVPTEIASANSRESPASQTNLERSISESLRDTNIRSNDAAKMLDDKISERKKMKILKRIATVHVDGTVEFELPSSLQPSTINLVPEDVYTEPVDEEPVDFSDSSPMQIVMLIVGTRGDVQPFIAIGKRLQDYGHYMVKNKGFLPSGPSEIAIQRQQIREIIYSLLPACEDADDSGIPFKAEAIIANPPAYG
ncbi:hypothetical protein ACLOJK_037538 [Asimina triloba]